MPDMDVVEAALKSKTIELSEFSSLIENGLVYNSMTESVSLIPKLSLFQLYMFSKYSDQTNRQVAEFQTALNALCLLDIRGMKDKLGYEFEDFHAQWKCVYSLLRRGWTGSLSDYYN